MTIFAVVSAFLTFVLILSCMGGKAISSSVVFGPFVRGFVTLFPAYLLVAWFEWGVMKQFMPFGLYIWHLTGSFLIPVVTLSVLGVLLIRPVMSEQPAEVFVGLTAFVSGFITAWALADLVFGLRYPQRYTLFLEPVLRISIMLMMPALLTVARGSFGFVRIMYILATVAWLFLLPVVPALYYLGFFAWASAVTVFLFLATGGVVYVLQGFYFSSYR